MTKHEKTANAIATQLLKKRPNYYRGRRKWARAQIVSIVLDELTSTEPLDEDLLKNYESEEDGLNSKKVQKIPPLRWSTTSSLRFYIG